MGIRIVRITEAFMLIWESGYRLNNCEESYTNNSRKSSKEVLDSIPKENLLSIGWPLDTLPNEEDDIEFLSQYSNFIRLFR